MFFMRKVMFIGVVLCGLLLLSGCNREGADLSVPSVATVDGAPITRTMLNVYLEQQGITDPTPEQSGEAVNNLIQLFSVSNAAQEDNAFQSAELHAALELEQRRLLFDRYAADYIERYPTSDAELQKQYRETVANAGGEQYRLETIVFPNEQEALSAILALQDGGSYTELSAANRTEALNWIDLSQVPGDYADAIKNTSTDDIVPVPLPSPQGWRLLKVVETRPFSPPAFDQVSDGMRRDLNRQKVELWINRLREKADVELENVRVE